VTEGPLGGGIVTQRGFTNSRRPLGESSPSWHPDTNTRQFRLAYCRRSVLLTNSPVGPRVLWGTADSLHDALSFKRLERDNCGPARAKHVPVSAERLLLSDAENDTRVAGTLVRQAAALTQPSVAHPPGQLSGCVVRWDRGPDVLPPADARACVNSQHSPQFAPTCVANSRAHQPTHPRHRAQRQRGHRRA
jgi:hypothetical protein